MKFYHLTMSSHAPSLHVPKGKPQMPIHSLHLWRSDKPPGAFTLTQCPPFFYIFIRESTDPIQLHPETGLYSCILTRKWAGTVQEEHTHLCIDHSTSTKRHLNTKTFLIATHCPYHLIPVSSSLNFASKVSLFNLL